MKEMLQFHKFFDGPTQITTRDIKKLTREFWTITGKLMTYNTKYAQFLSIMNINGMKNHKTHLK